MICKRIIETTNDALFSNINEDLTILEMQKFKAETPYLRFMILAWLLILKGSFGKKHYTSKEIGKIMSQSIFLGFQDNGFSKEEAVEEAELLQERFERYMKSVEDGMEKPKHSKEEKDVFFHLLTHFTNIVLSGSNIDLKNEADRDRHFVVFSFANQLYKHDAKAFQSALKKTSFIN